jgi:hypothetical protein
MMQIDQQESIGRLRMMSRHSTRPIPIAGVLCAAFLAVTPFTLAQTIGTDDQPAKAQETIDEIIVYGDLSLAQLRRQMHKASEAFFDVYNDINSDDQFDIFCDYETRLGERRRTHVCRPRFALKAEARETSAFMLSGGSIQRSTGPGAGFNPGYGYVTPISKRVYEKEAEMWQEVSELLAEHPGFQEAYEDLVRARSGYDSELARRNSEKSQSRSN